MRSGSHIAVLLTMFLMACGSKKDEVEKATDPADTTGPSGNIAAPVSGYNPADHIDFGGLPRYYANPAIDSLIKHKPQPVHDESGPPEYVHDYLAPEEMNRLSTGDLLYYCLQYPGDVSQICSDSYEPDSTMTPKIAAHFYFDYSGEVMSELQKETLYKRSDSVEVLVKKYIKSTPGELDENALVLLMDFDAIGNIPFVIETLSENHLVSFTYLALVMEKHNYQPFRETPVYEKLYGKESSYYSRIEASRENCNLIAKLAMDLYVSEKNK